MGANRKPKDPTARWLKRPSRAKPKPVDKFKYLPEILTDIEKEALAHFIQNNSYTYVAEMIGRSIHTVTTYIMPSIRKKVKKPTKKALYLWALELAYIQKLTIDKNILIKGLGPTFGES
jgi:DNA-binding CsgD family transcriptional regulator